MKNINELYSLLNSPKKIVITFHQKPDADAMGSGLAMYNFLTLLGHSCTTISPTNWAGFLNWMPTANQVVDYEKQTAKADELIKNAEIIFCLDFNNISRLNKMENSVKESTAIKVLIDHHQEPDVAAFDYGISEPDKASTSEMIYDFIVGMNKKNLLNKPISDCLYAGIVSDTGNFRFPNVTSNLHRIVADLFDAGLEHSIIHQNLFDNFYENRLRFMGNMFSKRLEFFYEYNTALIAIPKPDIFKYEIKTGDTEGLVNFPLSVQGIKFAALLIDRDEIRKWSFRSQGNFNCNIFAKKYFNGGGHCNAAGGHDKDSFEESIAKFKKALPLFSDELTK